MPPPIIIAVMRGAAARFFGINGRRRIRVHNNEGLVKKVRGCQKNMIVLRNTESKLFEEAYFVLRDGAGEHYRESDLLNEANRIIKKNENSEKNEKKPRVALYSALFFLAGIALGTGISLICAL